LCRQPPQGMCQGDFARSNQSVGLRPQRRADLRFDLTVQNLPETFRAAAGDITWKGFINHVDNVGPFFIAAKPSSYPDDVAYARATERPRFNRERPNLNNSGAVTFQCMGYAAP